MSYFCYDWFKEALKGRKPDENTCISPASALIALSMVYMGAKGETKAEMTSALRLINDIDELVKKIFPLSQNLTHDHTLKMANTLFLQEGLELQDQFAHVVKETFQASPYQIDFRLPKIAANYINSWVETNTNNLIHDLIAPDMIDNQTCTVLVNAIYMLAMWKSQFNKKFTHQADFNLMDKTFKVQMMRQDPVGAGMKCKFECPYGSDDDFCKYVALPYLESDDKKRSLEMMIFLPKKNTTVEALAQKLSHEYVNQCRKKTYEMEVDITLPKFQLEDSHDLEEALRALGMNRAFTEGDAEFDIIKRQSIYIQKVVQKVFMKVNEEGTEAAAATAVIGGAESCCFPPKFLVNKPFIVVVRDQVSGVPLFISQINKPEYPTE
jgi:serpin B